MIDSDSNHVTLMHYLEGLIADLRRDVEAIDKAQGERFDRLTAASAASLTEHKADDRLIAEQIQALDTRVSIIDGINAKVEALAGRVDKNQTQVTELQTASAAAGQAVATAAVTVNETAKTLTARIDVIQTTIDRNSDRLTKLETGGSQNAQETQAAEAKLEARVTAIESTASGANWVWQAMLAIGAFVVGAFGTWIMARSARREAEVTVHRRS